MFKSYTINSNFCLEARHAEVPSIFLASYLPKCEENNDELYLLQTRMGTDEGIRHKDMMI